MKELVALKKGISNQVNDTTNKTCAIKHASLEEMQQQFIRIKALKYNLSLVKEALAMVNGPIQAEITTKGDLEGTRITLERLLAKHQKKRDGALRDFLSGELSKTKKDIETITKILELYNEEKTINLELISI